MSEELAYSIHLGSDKNKTAKAKEIAKNNPSGETSFSNNGIQNVTQLSKVNKHNLRDYDNNKENIQIIYGTDNLYEDMQNLYFQEMADNRVQQIMSELKSKSDLTEDMKNTDMLYWVGTMNSIKAQAEEIIFSELIYA